MDLKTLRQYRALKKEIAGLDVAIERLRKQLDNEPAVIERVQASEQNFPYIQTSVSVEAYESQRAGKIRKLIILKERRREHALDTAADIEQYIQGIDNSTTRQIFELVFIDGLSYRKTGDAVGYYYTTIHRKIREQLATNATKQNVISKI